MKSKQIHTRASDKEIELLHKASGIAKSHTKAVIAGLHHVARICARCEQVGDCPWRSEGYPYCTPCVERDESIKLDDYNN